jgi:hypothetical protein
VFCIISGQTTIISETSLTDWSLDFFMQTTESPICRPRTSFLNLGKTTSLIFGDCHLSFKKILFIFSAFL